MNIIVPETIPRIRRNKIRNALFNIFRKCKLGFPVSKEGAEQVEIEIGSKEDLAIKIAYQKMKRIKEALDSMPGKIIINI